jgi:hypothetical protein
VGVVSAPPTSVRLALQLADGPLPTLADGFELVAST